MPNSADPEHSFTGKEEHCCKTASCNRFVPTPPCKRNSREKTNHSHLIQLSDQSLIFGTPDSCLRRKENRNITPRSLQDLSRGSGQYCFLPSCFPYEPADRRVIHEARNTTILLSPPSDPPEPTVEIQADSLNISVYCQDLTGLSRRVKESSERSSMLGN